MKKSLLTGSLYAAVFSFIAIPSHAAMISTFSFQSGATSCISEISTDCEDINTNGLLGSFQVDLDMLDASGDGSIPWNNFLSFDASNSISSWSLANLRSGGVFFNNWMVGDFGIDARPDYSNGWSRPTDGGGEELLISGFGISAPGSVPAQSNASSMPGHYCPSTGEWNPSSACPGGTVSVMTLGIQAIYSAPAIQAIPIPPALWLFGTGLLGLIGVARKKAA